MVVLKNGLLKTISVGAFDNESPAICHCAQSCSNHKERSILQQTHKTIDIHGTSAHLIIKNQTKLYSIDEFRLMLVDMLLDMVLHTQEFALSQTFTCAW
jgi:hypothetical protein